MTYDIFSLFHFNCRFRSFFLTLVDYAITNYKKRYINDTIADNYTRLTALL